MTAKDQKPIVSAIIIAGVLIAGAILLKGGGRPATNDALNPNTVKNTTERVFRPVSSEEHILGNPNAKVVIIEYSDLECPFCKVFHNTMHRVVAESNSNVAWVFRHYPIPQLHPKAFQEAEAAECAFDQGGNESFWRYVDRVFEVTPSNNGLDLEDLPKIAGEIGLDVNAFNTCLQSGKFRDKVQADVTDGMRAGVDGTPSSFILVDGKLVDVIAGAEPYEMVKQKIERAL